MNHPPSDTQMRDELALERTRLANERTLLSYARTSLAAGAGGFGLLQFVSTPAALIVGWILIVAGSALLLWGLSRFATVKARIESVRG